jgi:flagellin-like hook-associated protein FlgL
MSVVINTNSAATIAANNLAYSNAQLQNSLNKLSSGSKIVSPSDDAGGLAVSMKLTAAVNRESDLQNNLSDAVSYAQTQDGALQVAGSILDRISELATLYTDPTKNTSDLANYDDEFTQLQSELDAIGGQTFNGISLFGTNSLTVATTDDLASTGDVTLAQQSLLGAPEFSEFSDSFANLDNWSTSGTVSVSGGQLNLSGSDVTSTATTNATFGGGMRISMDVLVPGTGDTFTVSQGGNTLATLIGADNIPRNSWQSVVIDLSSSGTATTYLNGSATPLETQTGLSTTAGPIALSDFGLGAARVQDFSVTSTSVTGNMATVTAATSLGALSISTITGAIQDVATMRAENGAEQSRLNFASTLLTTNQTNLQSAISNITDVDVAAETTNLAKWNVLVQAGTSMLTQANQSAQVALKLITGA